VLKKQRQFRERTEKQNTYRDDLNKVMSKGETATEVRLPACLKILPYVEKKGNSSAYK